MPDSETLARSWMAIDHDVYRGVSAGGLGVDQIELVAGAIT